MLVVDFTVQDPASDGCKTTLVVTGIFTQFTQAFATNVQKADITVKVRLKEWFLKSYP